MTAENQAKIKELVDSLLPYGTQHKPHKLLLLLAWARLRYGGELEDPIVYYCPELINEFKTLFDRFRADGDRNRPYNPFFHLRTSGVWNLIPNEGQAQALEEATTIGGPGDLNRLVKGALLEGVLYDMLHDRELNLVFQRIAEQRLSSHQTNGGSQVENPFVAYLNTLQGLDANNQGALAEAQARQPLFNEIRIDHELAPVILNRLLGTECDPGDIILTGHAGDGKSTLALEVIRSIDADVPFEKRTEVACNGSTIVVVKDLSEWSEPERDALLDEILRGDPSIRHLIVSNTGALLSTFRDRCEREGLDRISVENDLLGAFDKPDEADFGFGTAHFKVHNLARRNNVEFGMRMLGRMVESQKWEDCRACPNSASCPIFANREILRKNRSVAFERIAWLYERAYAYGGRLTMRQLGAHFAFLLTGGLGCRAAAAGRTEAAFFNLFWGDDGHDEVRGAPRQLRAVALMREQGFNTLRSPSEDRLLREAEETPLSRTDPELAALEARLRAPVRARPGEAPEAREARAAQTGATTAERSISSERRARGIRNKGPSRGSSTVFSPLRRSATPFPGARTGPFSTERGSRPPSSESCRRSSRESGRRREEPPAIGSTSRSADGRPAFDAAHSPCWPNANSRGSSKS